MRPLNLNLPRRIVNSPLLGVWLAGLLVFRLYFLIITHNSVPLSGLLSFIFVLLPVVIVQRLRRYFHKKEEHALPTQRKPSWAKRRPPSRKPPLLQALSVLAILWLYLYGLRVRPITYDPAAIAPGEKYFLAVNFWDNEAILPSFFSSIFALSAHLGPQNLFLSIAENDSRDSTLALLRSYERDLKRLKIPYNLHTATGLRTANRTSYPDQPWLSVADRMSYMASIRNRALTPLYTSRERYSRIVFFNDVLWDPSAVLALLSTPGEEVCTLDFDSSGLYDAWVLKDVCGGAVSGMWPFFWGERERRAVRDRVPFEVGTCWNGIASLNAAPFLNSSMAEMGLDTPLRFPPSPVGCFMSECAALPMKLFGITKSSGPRAVVVPDATVAYTKKWWVWYNVVLRMRVVEWWVWGVERAVGWVWWPVLGPATRWKGIRVEGEKECVVDEWPRCGL